MMFVLELILMAARGLAGIVAMHPNGNGQPAPSSVPKSTRKSSDFRSLSFCPKSQISYGQAALPE
jgi:hypothetical protein